MDEIYEIKNINSNENPEILCKMNVGDKEIICVGNNKGLDVVDLEKKNIINNIDLFYQVTSMINLSVDNRDYLIVGAKTNNKRAKLNLYIFTLIMKYDEFKRIKIDIISKFESMHKYDINSLKIL